MTIVQSPKLIFQNVKYELSAMPVMMPGSAIGSTSRNEIDVAAEEPEAVHAERRHRPEDERDRGGEQRRP